MAAAAFMERALEQVLLLTLLILQLEHTYDFTSVCLASAD
jgi:hypothetical protein